MTLSPRKFGAPPLIILLPGNGSGPYSAFFLRQPVMKESLLQENCMTFVIETIKDNTGHILWDGVIDPERDTYLIAIAGIPGDVRYEYLDLGYQGHIIKIDIYRETEGRRTSQGYLVRPPIDDVFTTVERVRVSEDLPLTQQEAHDLVGEALLIFGTGSERRNGNISVSFSPNWYKKRTNRCFPPNPLPRR